MNVENYLDNTLDILFKRLESITVTITKKTENDMSEVLNRSVNFNYKEIFKKRKSVISQSEEDKNPILPEKLNVPISELISSGDLSRVHGDDVASYIL